ncbi:RNA polymerase II holoenzyme cyclin-like subunit [Spathaspora passalidarum NRRL Y-27907]|uniref:RNA polymerase II holoenzyme cyclin-like subunit n=1 Tax=Spathaspora passalidarum (strain NRRL Y-27907 / 11-Y1) TaxID=619300 RepID=G3AR22_SPAPN|nr:RNA polymerase II holoenzyme cyclin-like subunit [Spathaspora passalidarum NRRL Y-27907]EGW31683.1 RNA polymerase II holoenzyme cyclin-like subunit [Spathaspora passalidarum NRRL Y-27907]
MSADYWSSSQRNKWQLTRFSLLEARRKVLLLERKMIQNGLIKDYPNIVYDYNMRIYLHNLLIKLGRRLNVRQIALATAEVYLTRFLTRVSLKEINVYLLVTTCVYVACKIEECPQHIRLIINEARNIWPEYIPHDVTKLAEFEFYLIEEMDSYLLLHHPYKSLIQIKDYLVENYTVFGLKFSDEELQNAWSLINDSYITDLHLLVPPHIIAMAAIYITIVLKKNLTQIRSGANTDETKQDPKELDAKVMNIDDLMNLTKVNTSSQEGTSGHPQQVSTDNQPTTNFQDDLNILDEDTIKINKFMNFLDHSHINLDEMVEAMQDMINLYVLWNRYNEQGAKKALQVMLLTRM